MSASSGPQGQWQWRQSVEEDWELVELLYPEIGRRVFVGCRVVGVHEAPMSLEPLQSCKIPNKLNNSQDSCHRYVKVTQGRS
jgi:hypothetical protein